MRVRMLRAAATSFGTFQPGAVVSVPDDTAKSWCDAGIAMQDKSLDGPKEVKSVDLYWCNRCGCSHKASSKIGREHKDGS